MSWSSWFRINSRMVPRLKIGRLLLGGDSAHIHSPADAQGMNTGIQDMINLGWKLALVLKGKSPAALLGTYELDRLPVMRNLLFKTEKLTATIGSENALVRAAFNHLAPFIGGSGLVQENSTARMSQVALGYRGSPLSDNHTHGGALKAGDRVPPNLMVRRCGGDGNLPGRLGDLLDPSGFVVLVAHGDDHATAVPGLADAAVQGTMPLPVIELAPGDDASYAHDLGTRSAVFLVRPDGYIALAAPAPGPPRPLPVI